MAEAEQPTMHLPEGCVTCAGLLVMDGPLCDRHYAEAAESWEVKEAE